MHTGVPITVAAIILNSFLPGDALVAGEPVEPVAASTTGAAATRSAGSLGLKEAGRPVSAQLGPRLHESEPVRSRQNVNFFDITKTFCSEGYNYCGAGSIT